MLTQKDLSQIKKAFDERLEKKAGPLIEKKLKPIEKNINSIKKDTSVIISFFDREVLRLRQRIDRIEEHLNLPPLSNL